jgi:hypothetical protein
MLSGAQRNWLAARARTEGRTQSDVLASALSLYQQRFSRRAS